MKPNGRDYETDPVLRRLVSLDHATLILARSLQARDPHTEGVLIFAEDDDDNQGRILDVRASQAEASDTEAVPALCTDSGPPQTEEQQELTATAFRGNVENIVKPPYQEDDEVDRTIKWVMMVSLLHCF